MRARYSVAALFLVALASQAWVLAARPPSKPRRALPPKWKTEVLDVFFSDAREKLVGERPNFSTKTAARNTAGPSSTGGSPAPAEGGVFAWSKILSRDAVESEIKAQAMAVAATVTTPGPFKGGTFRDCRNQFSVLATMFAIAGEFDSDTRWRKEAPGLRDLFARAGFNCKVGTDQSYNEARARKNDLADLIRGDTVQSVNAAEAAAKWDKVSNRQPLMVRMGESFEKRISPWLANAQEFSKNSEQVLHEAQILAALGEVIQREEYEFADDGDYLSYSKQLRDASLEIVEAVKIKSYDKARAAAGNISKACSICHEGYRS